MTDTTPPPRREDDPEQPPVRRPPRRLPIVLVALAGMVFLAWLSENRMATSFPPPPHETTASLRERLLAQKTFGPFLRTIQQKEPDLFDQIVQSVQQGFREGASDDQISRSTQALISNRLLPRQGYLPDADLMATANHFVALMRQYSKTDPATCIALLQGRPLGDVRAYATPQLLQEGSELLQKLVGISPHPITLPSVSEVNAIMDKAIAAVRPKYGDQIRLGDLTQPHTEGEMRTSCNINADLFGYIAAMSHADSIGFFRAYYLDPAGKREQNASTQTQE